MSSLDELRLAFASATFQSGQAHWPHCKCSTQLVNGVQRVAATQDAPPTQSSVSGSHPNNALQSLQNLLTGNAPGIRLTWGSAPLLLSPAPTVTTTETLGQPLGAAVPRPVPEALVTAAAERAATLEDLDAAAVSACADTLGVRPACLQSVSSQCSDALARAELPVELTQHAALLIFLARRSAGDRMSATGSTDVDWSTAVARVAELVRGAARARGAGVPVSPRSNLNVMMQPENLVAEARALELQRRHADSVLLRHGGSDPRLTVTNGMIEDMFTTLREQMVSARTEADSSEQSPQRRLQVARLARWGPPPADGALPGAS